MSRTISTRPGRGWGGHARTQGAVAAAGSRVEALEARLLLHAGHDTAAWLDGSPGEYAQVIDGGDVAAAGPRTTWRGVTTPRPGDVHRVSYSDAWVYVQGPGLASHVMGPWFLPDGSVFPNYPADKNVTYRIPRTPRPATTHTATALGTIGLYVNGAAMFNALDAYSWSNTAQADRAGAGGEGVWQRDANVAEAATFDHANAHQPQDGTYHYHANPTALRAQLGDNIVFTGTTTDYFPYDDDVAAGSQTHANDKDPDYEERSSGFTHSPILGWSKDGYPVYGAYGYADPDDPSSAVVRIEPSYRLRNVTQRRSLDDWAARLHYGDNVALNAAGEYDLAANRYGPAVSAQRPLGYYIEDYEYVPALGHLDAYNGRFAVTPEFPQGTYAYYVTVDAGGEGAFPYAVGPQYYGVPSGGAVTSIGETVSTAFDITVGNTAPTVSAVPDQSTNQDTAVGPIAFTVGDAQTPAADLLVTASSSNPSLVPASGLALGGSGAGRTLTITPAAGASGAATITLTVTDAAGLRTSVTFDLTVRPAGQSATVVGRSVFYNNSSFDDPARGAAFNDDAAIATDKTALLPGQAATTANNTSYSRGINGIMVDVADLAGDGAALEAADLTVRAGTGGTGGTDPSTWAAAPTPSLTVRPGEGAGGADRVVLTWADGGAVRNAWLQVTLPGGTKTGLAAADVFYFGNLAGDADGNGIVNLGDFGAVRQDFGRTGLSIADGRSDFNRDAKVDIADFGALRGNFGRSLALTPSVVAPSPTQAPDGAGIAHAAAAAAPLSARRPKTAIRAVLLGGGDE